MWKRFENFHIHLSLIFSQAVILPIQQSQKVAGNHIAQLEAQLSRGAANEENLNKKTIPMDQKSKQLADKHTLASTCLYICL